MKKENIIILSVVVLGYAFLFFKIDSLQRSIANAQKPMVNSNGKIIYPYLEREVKNTITKNARAMQKCFNVYIQTKPEVTIGQIRAEWFITEGGEVENAEIIQSVFTDKTFLSCIIDAIGGWQFPPPDKRTYVEHTFRFQDQQSFEEDQKNRGKNILENLNE
ncbi:MAG: AgmX/PglI C-terminal domain-containing protein [Leptospiraceae bacterium]|nr:AgmX/PglI C-terminal domain-containing protein [Leptospiraceae bacterium]